MSRQIPPAPDDDAGTRANQGWDEPRLDHTGVPDLDLVLGGGLQRGALVLIVGAPGSGKSTLASHMAFDAARAGRHVVVVTAISESSTKLLAHLRSFAFYDDRLVGDMIQFMSLEQFLPSGLHVTGDELIAIARQTQADLVVLDGFRGVRGADVDPQAGRQFLYDVGTALSTLGATTLITSEADPRDPAFYPEATTADVIVGLHAVRSGVTQHRALEVLKMRGAAPLTGLHGLAITAAGVHVYPRLEARTRWPAAAVLPDGWTDEAAEGDVADVTPQAGVETSPAMPSGAPFEPTIPPLGVAMNGGERANSERANSERANSALTDDTDEIGEPFGLPVLDALLGNGVPHGSSMLVVGSLGSGKTFLGLHFALAGVRGGAPVLFLSFRENRDQLRRKLRGFALESEFRAALAPGGGLTLHHWDPIELQPDIVADRLLVALDQTGAQRLVVDSIAELEHAVARSSDSQRISDYLAALLVALRRRRVTALFIREHRSAVSATLDLVTGPASVLAENVLLLQQLEYRSRLHRVLSVVKTRYSGHDPLLHEFTIGEPDGLQVLGPFKDDGEVLATVTRHVEEESGAQRGILDPARDAPFD